MGTPDNTMLVRTAQNGLASLVEDADDDTLSFSVVASPAHGDLVLASNGSFTYTPDDKFNRVDSFTYRANDGTVDSNVATMTITIDTTRGWYNYKQPLDVDENDGIYPLDVLLIINSLNTDGIRTLPSSRAHPLVKPFYDVNRDGDVSTHDAIAVINWINNPAEGEAEAASWLATAGPLELPGSSRVRAEHRQIERLPAGLHISQLDDAVRSLQRAAIAPELLHSRSSSAAQLVDQLLGDDLESLLEDELAELLQ
jgi:VCBS repeat-containing protein